MKKVNIGDRIWFAGSSFDDIDLITVTKDNISIVEELFGRMYFDTEEEAEAKNRYLHGCYGAYQEAAMSGRNIWWL